MLVNEKIKAAEVHLTSVDGEILGYMPTTEALALAKQHKVDLVCTSMMKSPPECKLMKAGTAKQEIRKKKTKEPKLKEIRLSTKIEQHDYDTKKNKAEQILKSGNSVLLVIKVERKEGAQAKKLLEELIQDLKNYGIPKTGIQLSGKQAMVELNSR